MRSEKMNDISKLKDLSDKAFKEKYSCDRLTATIFANRDRYIIKHMCSNLLTAAFSIILRDWYDFAATISGPPEMDYAMAAVSNSLMCFVGVMYSATKNTVEEYGVDNIEPGDVLICNDPYRTGTHVNDVCFIRPVFWKGKIVSFVTIQAHQLDMGGTVPYGFSAQKKDIFETGLVIPPSLFYKKDQPYKPMWKLIFDNSRFGLILISDLKTIYEGLRLGERLILESIEKYGVAAFHGSIRYACDMSAESMQEGLSKVPDGVYEAESMMDADGTADDEEYHIKARIAVKGNRAEVDLSGTSRQARGSINGGYLDTVTGVLVGMKGLFDPMSPITSGSLRPIDIVLPEGTVVSALPPEGAIFLYWESSQAVMLTIWKAFREVLGKDALGGEMGGLSLHNAFGAWPDGRPWGSMAQLGGEHGPTGASKVADGENYIVPLVGNGLDPATEPLEADVPVVIMRKEYITDSAGAGIHRGGASVVKDTLWYLGAQALSMPLMTKTATGFGAYGGKDGILGGVWMWDPDQLDIRKQGDILSLNKEVYAKAVPVGGVFNPETNELDSKNGKYFYPFRVPGWLIKPYGIFRYITNGGGGWGNPLEKDPEAVKRDVRDEYVSIEGAKKDYGVVITGDPHRDPENLKIDLEATQKLRKQVSA
jgi:N-methylhydantoinase B